MSIRAMTIFKTPGMIREIVTVCPKHKAEIIAHKHKDTMFYIVVLCENVDL